MLLLVEIDFEYVDFVVFEVYEVKVLVLLSEYGGILVVCVWLSDGMCEFYFFDFFNFLVFEVFCSDLLC